MSEFKDENHNGDVSGIIDATDKFEEIRDANILEEATSSALPKVLAKLKVNDEELPRANFARLGILNADKVLKDKLRVPIFVFLAAWCLLAAYMRKGDDGLGWFFLAGFSLLAALLAKDAFTYAVSVLEQEIAKKEHLRTLSKQDGGDDKAR
jgi:hypothetical protein